MADSDTPLLDRVEKPADLRRLTERQLRQFADELRRETIAVVSDTGGHLGAGLGVVEVELLLLLQPLRILLSGAHARAVRVLLSPRLCRNP